MARRKYRSVVPGDVFELVVRDGFVYLQAIGHHKSHGAAVRVVAPVRSHATDDVTSVLTNPDFYVVLMGDLGFEESEGRLRYVSRAAVPLPYRDRFPIFRASSSYLPDGRHRPDDWWLDDGENEWRVGELSVEQQRYPYRQFTPAFALRDLIDRGWDPEWEFKGPDAQQFAAQPRNDATRCPEFASFFFTFKNERDALRARDEILRQGFASSVAVDDLPPDETGRTPHVIQVDVDRNVPLENIESLLERVASDRGGEYDGNEIPIE